MKRNKVKIAFWFRYGAAEHAELFHAIPRIIDRLSQSAEVHYFGTGNIKPLPPDFPSACVFHTLPFHINRTSERDKLFKTILWILLLPLVGLYCRFTKIDVVYIDETVPLTAAFAHLFYGGKVAFTIADMFIDIYERKISILRFTAGLIRRVDHWSWRKLSLIFTRAKNTRTFLAEKIGIDSNIVAPVYDPCDFSLYYAYEPTRKEQARLKFGFGKDDIILVHHGILHPNKGNDFIIKALHSCQNSVPNIRYLLIGDGPEKPTLLKLINRLNMQDRITLAGWLPKPSDVCEALNASDIGLVMRVGHQSDDFHMTGALVHNMACGLPLLAARLAGISEVVTEGINGRLFDPHNSDSFVQALENLYKHPEDRVLMAKHSSCDARKFFNMRVVVEQTANRLIELAQHG